MKNDDVKKLRHDMVALLRTQDSTVQALMLADLLAVYIVGHEPAHREEILYEWVQLVLRLVPTMHSEILKKNGVERWDDLPPNLGRRN